MSTPTLLLSGYAFRPGMRLKPTLNPTAIGHEIAELRDEKDVVKAPDVVEAAKPTTSAMHEHFEWDDMVAGQHWREDQARYLLRSIVPVYADTRTEEEFQSPDRAFVALNPEGTAKDDESVGAYQFHTVQTAKRPVAPPKQPTQPQESVLLIAPPPQILRTPERERALTILKRWADSYQDDPYFAGVVAAIRALD